MTCKEKLAMEHPRKVMNGEMLSGAGCPSDYGYLDDPHAGDSRYGLCGMSCTECWNREIPEEKAHNPLAKAYTLLVAFHHHGKDIDFDEVIGYLGEALDEHYGTWPIDDEADIKAASEDLKKVATSAKFAGAAFENLSKAASEALDSLKIPEFEHQGPPLAKVKDSIEENGGIKVVLEPVSEHAKKLFEEPTEKKEYRAPYDKLRVEVGCTIKDSGDRTEFATGAVRDMREGKGRCDLMPLKVVADTIPDPNAREILTHIVSFQETGDSGYLSIVLGNFARRYPGDTYLASLSTMFLEVAKHFEEGAKKYGENNWQKGIPVHCYIDSAIRHYLKWLRGDKDEPHDRAFVWNLMCCIWEVDYHEKGNEDD